MKIEKVFSFMGDVVMDPAVAPLPDPCYRFALCARHMVRLSLENPRSAHIFTKPTNDRNIINRKYFIAPYYMKIFRPTQSGRVNLLN